MKITWIEKSAPTWGVMRAVSPTCMNPYILPQDCGQREDASWLNLSNGKRGLVICGSQAFSFSALRYDAPALYKAAHTNNLIPDAEVHLRINSKARGLGTLSCGPDTLDQYRIDEDEYTLEFWMHAVDPEDEDPSVLYAQRRYLNS